MARIDYRLRNVLQIAKGVVLMAFGLVIVGASLGSGSSGRLAVPGLVALGVALLAYAIYFAPRLLIDEHGLTSINWATQCHVPWRAYTGVGTRFGMVLASADSAGEHRDAVACFPGSGGLARGRERLGQAHPLGGRPHEPAEALPVGGRTAWVSSRQAAVIVEWAAGQAAGGDAGAGRGSSERASAGHGSTSRGSADGGSTAKQGPAELDGAAHEPAEVDGAAHGTASHASDRDESKAPEPTQREGAATAGSAPTQGTEQMGTAGRTQAAEGGRVRRIVPASAACLAAGTLCLASGVWLSLP